MLPAVIYFLPALVSLMWAVVYSIRDDGKGSTVIAVVQYLSFAYFAALAMSIWPETPDENLSYLDLAIKLTGAVILILNICFIYSLNSGKHINVYLLSSLLFVSVCIFLLILAFYYIIGFKEASEFLAATCSFSGYSQMCEVYPQYGGKLFRNFIILDMYVSTSVCGVYALGLFGMIISYFVRSGVKVRELVNFLLRDAHLNRIVIINFMEFLLGICISVIMVVGRVYLYSHTAFSIVMSLVLTGILFLLSISVYNTETKDFRRRDLMHFHMAHTIFDEPLKQASPKQQNTLDSRLEQCLANDDIHLDPDITIDKLAERLGTNHTALSYIINHNYGMTFRELISRKRVESAKKYLLNHPDATMDEVAINSGFNTQTSFYNRFKALTDMTPKAWLYSHLPEKSSGEAEMENKARRVLSEE